MVYIPYSETNVPAVSKDLFFGDALTFGINKNHKEMLPLLLLLSQLSKHPF